MNCQVALTIPQIILYIHFHTSATSKSYKKWNTFNTLSSHQCVKEYSKPSVAFVLYAIQSLQARIRYLWSCGFRYGGVWALGSPRNAFYHMLMFSELSFALLCCYYPNTHRLVIRTTGNQGAILVRPHHAHPFSVSRKSLHTITVREEMQALTQVNTWLYKLVYTSFYGLQTLWLRWVI